MHHRCYLKVLGILQEKSLPEILGCSYKLKRKRKQTVNNTPNFYVWIWSPFITYVQYNFKNLDFLKIFSYESIYFMKTR